jgi:hypothetical protein
MFVDNRTRTVFGEKYLEGYDREGRADRLAAEVMTAVRTAYDEEAAAARRRGLSHPPANGTLARLRSVIEAMIGSEQSS